MNHKSVPATSELYQRICENLACDCMVVAGHGGSRPMDLPGQLRPCPVVKVWGPGTLKNLGPSCKLKRTLSTCLYH